LHRICDAVREIVRTFDDVEIVLPVHANPEVGNAVRAQLGHVDRVHLTPPLSYGDLLYVLRRCELTLTDSGGIQEEAPSFGCPVLILRELTERPEVVEVGAGEVVGTERVRIVDAVSRLLTDDAAYEAMASAPNPFGDGHAADRIVEILKESFDRRRVIRVV
jgi:UDP-N-acetylglucosamine 2-epimerase